MFATSIIVAIALGYALISYSNSARMAPRGSVALAALVPAAFVALSVPASRFGFNVHFSLGPIDVPLLVVAALIAGVVLSNKRMASIIEQAADAS